MGTVEQELLRLEKRYWQAIKDRDGETAMRLTDDHCIVTGSEGIGRLDRSALGGMITDAPYTLNDFAFADDAQVRMLSDDVAVVAYRVHEDLTVDGKHVELDAADSSTWVRRNGRWVCALHSEALVGDPYGRDRRDQ